MKQKVGVLLTLILFASFSMPLTSISVELETLTVDQALKWAIDASAELRNLESNITNNEKKLDQIKEQFYVEQDYATVLDLAVQMMQLEQQESLSNGNIGVAKESLRISVMNLFASIIDAQQALALTDQNLSIMERELLISKVKHSLGYISKVEYTTQENNMKKSKSSRESQNLAITNAFVSLNKLMGTSLSKQYRLSLDFTYEPIKNGLQAYVSAGVLADTSVASQQVNVEVAEYELELNDPFLHGEEAEEDKEQSVTNASRDLYDTERTAEQKVVNAYNKIMDQEISYNNARLELDDLLLQKPVKEKQYELGKLTKLELDKFYYKIAQQEESIRKLTISHAIAIQQIDNPETL
ncbi:MAG: TolC family protein [Clostridiales bacterium]|jgi:hypothetical protein|nr:TolC family protein [Clostridiales bacterium]